MKTKPEMDPAAAFSYRTQQPVDADLKTALGPAGAPLLAVLAEFRAANAAITTAWQFSEQSGWYQLHLLKKRRLLYLVPKHGAFRVMLILGGKAIAQLKAGPQARPVLKLLKTARRYPEGTAFSFDHKSVDPDLLTAFLAAKLAH